MSVQNPRLSLARIKRAIAAWTPHELAELRSAINELSPAPAMHLQPSIKGIMTTAQHNQILAGHEAFYRGMNEIHLSMMELGRVFDAIGSFVAYSGSSGTSSELIAVITDQCDRLSGALENVKLVINRHYPPLADHEIVAQTLETARQWQELALDVREKRISRENVLGRVQDLNMEFPLKISAMLFDALQNIDRGGKEKGRNEWRILLANEWVAIEKNEPNLLAYQVRRKLLEKLGELKDGEWTNKDGLSEIEKLQFDSLRKVTESTASDYRGKLKKAIPSAWNEIA